MSKRDISLSTHGKLIPKEAVARPSQVFFRIALIILLSKGIMEPQAQELSPGFEERTFQVRGFSVRVIAPQRPIAQEMLDLAEGMSLLNNQLERVHKQIPDSVYLRLSARTKFHIDWCNGRGPNGSRTDGMSDYSRNSGTGSINGQQYWITIRCYKYMANVLQDYGGGGELVGNENRPGNSTAILHELAHAWHDGWIEGGFENAEIKAAYQDALKHYPTADADGKPWYWTTDEREWFAEFSCMYFDYRPEDPRDRDGLRLKDRMLIEKFWGIPSPATRSMSPLPD